MLNAFGEGVWIASGPVSFLGLRLTSTMTVLRLPDGALLVHSPLPLTAERLAEVSSLGLVTELYAPNTFHHMWLGAWISAFPKARVHAPEELALKRPELRIDRFHDRPGEDACLAGVDEIPIRGFRLRETALLHRASRTALVTDLVHNIGRPEHAWTKTYTKVMGFYDRLALSRFLRWTAFDDRGAARESIDALLGHSFDGLIVGHGAPITSNGRELLASATSWLPTAAKLQRAPRTLFPRLLEPCG
jgi:hypothetical protein